MGGSSSSRHIPVESMDAEGVVFVKGIRLSDKVVDRMRETPPAQGPQSKICTRPLVTQPVTPQSNILLPTESLAAKLSHPSSSVNTVVPPLQESSSPLVPTSVPASGHSVQKDVVMATPTDSVPLVSPAEPLAIPTSQLTVNEPVTIPQSSQPVRLTSAPAAKSADISQSLLTDTDNVSSSPPTGLKDPVKSPTMLLTNDILTASSVKAIHLPSSVGSIDMHVASTVPATPSFALGAELPLVSNTQLPAAIEDTPSPRPVVAEPAIAQVLPPLTEALGPLTSPQIVVTEEDLRKKIREELQILLQEEKKMAELKIQQHLKEVKAKAQLEAQATAQQQIQILMKEQLALQQTLKDAIIQECKNIQHGQLTHKYNWMKRKKQIAKLEEKERDLAKQDLVYKEQLAKLEEKAARFSRVTAQSFKNGLEETHRKFKRNQMKPVCSELQSEILKCYLQNTGKSLTCSRIASQYVKCVNNAKQNKKVSTGG